MYYIPNMYCVCHISKVVGDILLNYQLYHWQVPTFAYEKRLSRIETLRLAITYIAFMAELLSGPPEGGEQHLTCRPLPAPCYPCPAGVPFSQLRSI